MNFRAFREGALMPPYLAHQLNTPTSKANDTPLAGVAHFEYRLIWKIYDIERVVFVPIYVLSEKLLTLNPNTRPENTKN